MTKINPFKTVENTSIKYPECLEYLKGCSKAEILENVKETLIYIEKNHQYSMSRLYSLWNFIFDRNEVPQTCSSCLIRKSSDLREWMSKEKKVYNELSTEERENYYKSPDANRDVLGYSVSLDKA